MSIAYPTSLKDVFPAPVVADIYGNRLNRDWTVSFPRYSFGLDSEDTLFFSKYRAIAAWPRLYEFVAAVVDAAEKSEKPKTSIRDMVLAGVGNSGNVGQIINILIASVMDCKGLMAVSIIGLIMAIIIVPIAAGLTYCLVKRRYSNDFRYQPYSSDSLTAASSTSMKRASSGIGVKTLSANNSFHQVATYSHGLIAMAIIAIISALFAAFGVGSSFYFNDSFSFSLNRSADIVQYAISDINTVITHYGTEVEFIAGTMQTDIKHKIDFAQKVVDSLGGMFTDQGTIIDLAQRSSVIWLLLYILTWENVAIKPMQQSIGDTKRALASFNDLEQQVMSFQQQGSSFFGETRMRLCQRYNITAPCTQPNTTITGGSTCWACSMPDFPPTIDPFQAAAYRRVQMVLTSMEQKINTLNQVKLGQLGLDRDQLLGQLGNLKTSFMNDFSTFIGFYENWYHLRIEAAINGGGCDDLNAVTAPTAPPITPPITTPALTTVPIRPNMTLPNKANATTPPTSATPAPPADMATRAVQAIHDAFNDRHYITLALLIVATIQLAVMIGGCGCLLYVYFTQGANHERTLRWRQPPLIEKIGRIAIIASAIVYIAFTGPLLCILAAGHFFVGGYINKSICNIIRREQYDEFDQILSPNGDNILRHVLPVCMQALADSIDHDLLDRVTIGGILKAMREGDTLNGFLQFNDTEFIRDVMTLKRLTLTTRLVVYNQAVDTYMTNLSDIAASRGLFQSMINKVNMADAMRLNSTVKNCTQCVLNSFQISNNSTAADFAIQQTRNTALQYKNSLDAYLGNLNATVTQLGDISDTLGGTLDKKMQMMAMMLGVENYFQVVISLVKTQAASMVSTLFKLLFEEVTANVLNLGFLFGFYDGLVREYGCVELVGAMNAFWFFVGIYMVFATISALLVIATYAVLQTVGQNSTKGSVAYWHGRSSFIRKVNTTTTMIEPINSNNDMSTFTRLQNSFYAAHPSSTGTFTNKAYAQNESFAMSSPKQHHQAINNNYEGPASSGSAEDSQPDGDVNDEDDSDEGESSTAPAKMQTTTFTT